VLNGSKSIFGQPNSNDFLLVFAKTREASSGTAGFSIFILDVDGPGFSLNGKDEIILQLDDCLVGHDALLGEAGQAFKLGAEEAPRAWIRISARFVGLADRLVSLAADYARNWVAMGSPLMDRPAIKQLLAEISVQVNSTRWLAYHAAWQADQGVPLHVLAAEVRLAAGVMIQKVMDLAIMVYGGPGPSPEIDLSYVFSSVVPIETLKLGAEGARNILAADILKVNR
jgi:alkylation response protein AidB-like acyl-CoA dehydrogenase